MAADEVLITGEIVRDERGRLTLDVTDDAKRFLARAIGGFKKEGACTVTVRMGKEPKSVRQMRYLHGVVFKAIAEETGNAPEAVKEELKKKFLARSVEFVDMETGEQTTRIHVPSLADLDVEDCRKFIDDVTFWAAEWLGMTIEPQAAA